MVGISGFYHGYGESGFYHVCTGCLKKRYLVILDLLGLSKHLYNQLYKSIDFYPKLWYPEAWVPVVYSINCMVLLKSKRTHQKTRVISFR